MASNKEFSSSEDRMNNKQSSGFRIDDLLVNSAASKKPDNETTISGSNSSSLHGSFSQFDPFRAASAAHHLAPQHANYEFFLPPGAAANFLSKSTNNPTKPLTFPSATTPPTTASTSTPQSSSDYFQLMFGTFGKNQMVAAALAAAAAAAASSGSSSGSTSSSSPSTSTNSVGGGSNNSHHHHHHHQQPPRLHHHHHHSSSPNPNDQSQKMSAVDELIRNSAAVMAANNAAAAAAAAAANSIVVKNSIKLCRRRKARTVFSDQQLSGLEKRFETQKYLSTPERVELANSLGLSETQVSQIKHSF